MSKTLFTIIEIIYIFGYNKMFTNNRQSYANPILFGQHSGNQSKSKVQAIKPAPVIIMNQNLVQKQTKPDAFPQQRSSIQFNFQPNPAPIIFNNKPKEVIQIEPTNKELNQKIKSLEQKNTNLQQMYKKLKHQFDTYKASSLNKNDYLSLLKEIEQLKLKINSMKKQQQAHEKDKPLFNQLKQSVQTLKEINGKKETQLTRAILLIQKQSQIIQNQSLRIDHLSDQIQKGLIQKNNVNQSMFHNSQETIFNNVGFSFHNQNSKLKPELPKKINISQTLSNNLFQKKQSHPLSQSAVFKYPSKQQTSITKIEYPEGIYLVQYNRTEKGMINELNISNLNGKIQILQPIYESEFKSKPIDKLVQIQQNSCQIIDPILQNRKVRLTTFNFMNCKMLNFAQKINLRQQVQQQVKKCGLYLEYFDLTNGNLYLLTKK